MSASFAGFGSIKTNSKNDSVRLEEVVEMIKWVDKKYVLVRILNKAPLQVRQIWIKLYAGQGNEKREVSIPRYSISFDPNNPDKPKKGVKCPYTELADKFKGQKDAPVRSGDFWLFNVIDREMQEDGPPRKAKGPTKSEKKTGFKDINSETWTPVKVGRFTSTMIQRIAELSAENKKKDKKTGKVGQYDATDIKFGFDLKVKYKKDAPGTDKYSIDKEDGGATPLTKDEQEYLVWDLSEKLLDATGRETEEQANEQVKRMNVVGMEIPDDDDDDDDKKKKKKKGKSRSLDDEDEDDTPKKSKGKRKKPFDDDDDDDEDEKPKKSSKSKKSSKVKEKVKEKTKSKKSKKDDDEDEDEDEKPKKSSKTSKDKKASKVKEKVKEKPSKKKSKKDDDDEDEKPKKKKAVKEKTVKSTKEKATKGKTGKKKKKSDWDDD